VNSSSSLDTNRSFGSFARSLPINSRATPGTVREGCTSKETGSCSIERKRASTSSSGKIGGLSVGSSYHWRCRSYDGYEHSGWSDITVFKVRNPVVVPVPSVYATLQQALDIAREGDTVLVAPGEYTGPGNIDLDFRGINIVMKSESGAVVTSITLGGSESDRHRALSLDSGEDTTSIIDGFTIGDGYVDTAAIFVEGGGLSLRNCVVGSCSNTGLWSSESAFVIIDSCTFMQNTDGAYLSGDGRVSFSVFSSNEFSGMGIMYTSAVDITNCTFVMNGYEGFYITAEPPKATLPRLEQGLVSNCIAAFNGSIGFLDIGYSLTDVGGCNNSYGNAYFDYPYYIVVGEDGNISVDPVFCDTATSNYNLSDGSPCAPNNNECNLLIGALPIGCTGCCVNRGNADGVIGPSGPLDVADVTYLVAYLFTGGPEPSCVDEGNVDGLVGPGGPIDVADLTYLVAYLFTGGPEPPQCL